VKSVAGTIFFKKRYSFGLLARPDGGEQRLKTFFREMKVVTKSYLITVGRT